MDEVDWERKRERDLEQLRNLVQAGIASGFEPHDDMASIKDEARRRLAETSE